MINNSEDYVVRLKLDSSELEKEYPKTFAKLQKAQARQNKAYKAEQSVLRQSNSERLSAVSIARQQERLLNKINRAEQQGLSNLKKYKQMAKSKDRSVLGNADVGLSKRIRTSTGVSGSESLGMDINALKGRATNVTHSSLRDQMSGYGEELGSLKTRLNMAKTKKEVRSLRLEYNQLKSAIAKAERSQDKYNRTIRKGGMLSSLQSSGMLGVAGKAGIAGAVGAGVVKTFGIGKSFDSMQAGLIAASGTAEDAAKNWEFLKETSMTLGTDIQQGAGAFNRLAVAAKGAGFSMKDTQEIYLSAAEASTVFGLDTQRQGLVMLAFSQIMSKGRVSMEELSRQLGENFPIAMEAASKAMGVNQGELIKMVESGKLLAKDFMLPFAKQIRKQIRSNGAYEASLTKVNASMGRMINAFKLLANEIFKGEGASSIGSLFEGIATSVTSLTVHIKALSDPLIGIVSAMARISANFSLLNGQTDDATGRVGGLMRGWYGVASAIMYVVGTIEKISEVMSSLTGGKGMTDLFYNWMTFSPTAYAYDAVAGTGKGSSSTSSTVIGDDNRNTVININGSSSSPKAIADELVDRMAN